MPKILIGSAEFRHLINCGKSTISKCEARPILTYIYIKVTETTVTGVACDGYSLSKYEFNHDQKEVYSFECYIKPLVLPKDLLTVELSLTDKTVAEVKLIGLESISTQSFIQPEGEYLNYQNFMPAVDDTLSIAFDAKRLITLLEPYCAKGHGGKILISFVRQANGINDNSPAIITGIGQDKNTMALISPAKRC